MKPLTIVALAIVAALGLALGLNITTEPETKTTYSTVADLTPTIEHETVSNWAELSPSSNWTGYYPYSGYTFTPMPDNVYNRYGVQPSADPEITVIDDVKEGGQELTTRRDKCNVFDIGNGILSNGTFHRTTATVSQITRSSLMYMKPLSSLATFGDDPTIIDFDAPCCIPLTSSAYDYRHSGVQIYLRVCGSFGSDLQRLAQKVMYTPATNGQPAYYSGADADGNPVWTYQAGDSNFALYIIWGGTFVTGYPLPDASQGFVNSVVSAGPDPTTATITITPKLDEPVVYMDIRDGITVYPVPAASSTVLNWENGYVNGSISFLVRTTSGGLNVRDGITHDWLFRYDRVSNSDEAYITGAGQMVNLGNTKTTWKAVLVEINAIDGKFKVTPIIDFIDFQNWSMGPTTYSYDFSFSPVKKLEIYCNYGYNSDPVIMGIVSTKVATDPNELLWLNPVIESNAWFPQITMRPYSVYFRSGVTYGDSITINNQTFAVSPTGYITIEGMDYPVVGMSVDWPQGSANGHVLLRLAKGTHPITIDLGPVEATRITATGIWYAQVDLRTISTETQDAIKYDPDAWDKADAKTVLVIFMVVCTALAMWAMRSKEMSTGGVITVIVALAIAWITLGVVI